MTERPTDGWHLDKRIPVALIITMISTIAGGSMWVGTLDTRVDQHEKSITALESANQVRTSEMIRIEGRLSSLEATSQAQLETLRRIERLLDRSAME